MIEKRKYNIAKLFYISIKKEYEFDRIHILQLYDDFFKKLNAKSGMIVLGLTCWKKGYMKYKTILKYSRGVENFIIDYGNYNFDSNTLDYYAKIDNKKVSLSFSSVKEIDNTIMGHSINLFDEEWYLDENLDQKILNDLRALINEKYIEKAEISDYKNERGW